MLTTVNFSGQRYLVAARQVLDEGGIRALTIRAVAAAAGTTATAIYRHYADKDELVDRLHRVVFEDFKARVSGVSLALGARRALLTGLDIYREFGLEQPAAFEFLFIEPHGIRTSRYPEDFQRARSSTFRLLVAGVEACLAEGLVPRGHALEVALGLEAQALGLMMLYRSGRFGEDVDSFRRFYRNTLERQIGGNRA